MEMRKIILFTICLAIATLAYGQQALGEGSAIVSPDVHEDNTVTFRLQAPGAKEVKLCGSWITPKDGGTATVDMFKDASGLWTYTTDALPSDLYSYYFLVDGLDVKDPNNVYMNRESQFVPLLFK
jgi:enterochelin esterase family protein